MDKSRRAAGIRLLGLTLAGLAGRLGAAQEAGAEPLRFGVVPQQSTRVLVERWTPLLQYLEQYLGVGLQFETARDIPTFEQRLLAGEYDLAYMNPYHYTVFHETTGYLPLVKESEPLRGIIVVPVESPLQSVEDLRGLTLAFPSPTAFAASVLPRTFLLRSGIPFEVSYVASHDSVYRAVAMGLHPAGGGVARTFRALEPALRERLRVLWTTPPLTPHAVAAHPRVDAALAERVRALLVDMAARPRGRDILETLGFDRFEPAQDADYDDVRELQLTLLKHLIRD